MYLNYCVTPLHSAGSKSEIYVVVSTKRRSCWLAHLAAPDKKKSITKFTQLNNGGWVFAGVSGTQPTHKWHPFFFIFWTYTHVHQSIHVLHCRWDAHMISYMALLYWNDWRDPGEGSSSECWRFNEPKHHTCRESNRSDQKARRVQIHKTNTEVANKAKVERRNIAVEIRKVSDRCWEFTDSRQEVKALNLFNEKVSETLQQVSVVEDEIIPNVFISFP